MIGHIKPKVCKLPPRARDEYVNLYCSICYGLRCQLGVLGTLFTNSELAIILLALRRYFTPRESRYGCPAKLHFTSKPISIHKVVNCASKFSFLLGWLKVLDWETDKPAFYKKGIRKILDRKAGDLLATLNEESRHVIEEYHNLTASNSNDFSDVREMSRLLCKTICAELGKQTLIDNSDLVLLSDFFGRVGEIVAVADPLIDLRKDVEAKEYNPIWESVVSNGSDISSEYEKYRSEYHRIGSRIRVEMADSGLRNILNDDFTTTLQLGLDELSSQIIRKRDQLLDVGSGLHSKNTVSICDLSGKSSRANLSPVPGSFGPYSAPFGYRVRGSSRDPKATSSDRNQVRSIMYREQPELGKSSIHMLSRHLRESKKPRRTRRIAACCGEECADAACWVCCDCMYCCEGCEGCDCGDGGCGDCDCDCS